MSSDVALRVQGIEKQFTIRHKDHDHITLAQAALHRLAHPRGASNKETFWALKDISFDVPRGEVLGIIGRNGAGKSTLLKILSKITPPTKGRIDVYGRVGSLLEVGTGFNPELTGRENIYLNGAILGMKRKEIDRQFDAIVDFSGVERFLDTPVKRYSSGMYVRLAFAVAAHLDTEILIVDEVLAVGDAEFQDRCLGKMDDAASSGRTVLLVSHNLDVVNRVCTKVAWLRSGHLVEIGATSDVVKRYQLGGGSDESVPADRRVGLGSHRISGVDANPLFDVAEPKTIIVRVAALQSTVGRMWVSALIKDSHGTDAAHCDSRLMGLQLDMRSTVEHAVELAVIHPWLRPGKYSVDLFLCTTGATIDMIERATEFEVSSILPYESHASSDATDKGPALTCFSARLLVGSDLGVSSSARCERGMSL
jgi:lipopolysaccharide transport system ATP-binding protein